MYGLEPSEVSTAELRSTLRSLLVAVGAAELTLEQQARRAQEAEAEQQRRSVLDDVCQHARASLVSLDEVAQLQWGEPLPGVAAPVEDALQHQMHQGIELMNSLRDLAELLHEAPLVVLCEDWLEWREHLLLRLTELSPA